MLELLRYNVKVNNLEDRILILELDLRYIKEDLSPQIFDVVIANPLIIEDLQSRGLLLYKGTIRHSYPHCWRCKNPAHLP